MKATFPQAMLWLLQHEGGWSDHPDDPGGATMQGITLAVFRRYYGADKTKTDLHQITPEQVAHIYRAGYWNPCQCDYLPAGVDWAVFDSAVNSGPARSARWLQRAVAVKMDGLIGPVTLVASAWQDPTTTINQMLDYRLQFLRGLESWSTFGRGWTQRVKHVRRQALQLVQPPIETLDETKS